MKTILVIGADGFVGSNVVRYFQNKHKIIATFNKHIINYPGVSRFMFSLKDRDYIKRLVTLTKPEVIIYCAGLTDFMECAKRPQAAEAINTLGPVLLFGAADAVVHRFIYLSTAYVYDGKKGNFSEDDLVFPETQFAKGKLAGENYVRSKSSIYTIFRFSPIYGIGSIYHPSLFDKIRMKLERGTRAELPENETHSFLSMDIALKAIEWVITQESKNATYNLGGLTKISLFEYGKLIAETLNFNPNLITPGQAQFQTDVDFSLNGSEIVTQLDIDPLTLEQGLNLLKKQLVCGLTSHTA